MAAPTYRNGTQPVLSDSGTVSSPSDTAIGDLVIIFLWSQGANQATLTHTLQGGFTEIRQHAHDDGTTDGRLSVAYKVATAAGVQSYVPYTIANATAGQTAVGCIVLTVGTFSLLATFPQASSTLTTTGVPNPPQITGLYGDYLVLAIAAWHVTSAGSTTTAPGANYVERLDAPAGSHVTHLAVATRALTGLSNSTEDPPAFTDNVTPNGSVSMTVGVAMIIGGSSTPTLGAATASTDADALVAGSATPTLGAATASTDAGVIVVGSATPTLGAATASTDADALAAGSAAFDLDDLALIASARAVVTGSGAAVLAPATLAAEGGAAVSVGNFASFLAHVTLSATGVVTGGQVAVGTGRAISVATPSWDIEWVYKTRRKRKRRLDEAEAEFLVLGL